MAKNVNENGKVASATVENGFLVVRVPLQPPTPSSTGRTLLVATGKFPTSAVVNGKTVTVGINAYIKP